MSIAVVWTILAYISNMLSVLSNFEHFEIVNKYFLYRPFILTKKDFLNDWEKEDLP